jgi:hypothetical protein
VASMMHDLEGFRQGPEMEDWDAEAYTMLMQIPGTALGSLADMLAHGVEIRKRLEHFNERQDSMRAALDAMTTSSKLRYSQRAWRPCPPTALPTPQVLGRSG